MNRQLLRTAVLFDKDSCLADTRHRWHLSPMVDQSSDWNRYCAAAGDDSPILGTVAAARLYYPHHQVHVCSGSNDSGEDVTRRWLALQGIPFDGLRLRAEGDDRPNADIKIAYILELRAAGIETVLVYEDFPPVAGEIQERISVPVVCVNPRYPEDAARFAHSVFDSRGGGL